MGCSVLDSSLNAYVATWHSGRFAGQGLVHIVFLPNRSQHRLWLACQDAGGLNLKKMIWWYGHMPYCLGLTEYKFDILSFEGGKEMSNKSHQSRFWSKCPLWVHAPPSLVASLWYYRHLVNLHPLLFVLVDTAWAHNLVEEWNETQRPPLALPLPLSLNRPTLSCILVPKKCPLVLFPWQSRKLGAAASKWAGSRC